MKLQKIFLYTTLLLLSMSCSLELPENTKSLKTCIKATGITAIPQTLIVSDSTVFQFSLSLTGTTSDIAKVEWLITNSNGSGSGVNNIPSPFSWTLPAPKGNGLLTITAKIVDKCGMSYTLTTTYVNNTCIKATGITATAQSTSTSTLSLSLTGTTRDIANVVWVGSQNGTEYYRSSTLTGFFSWITPSLTANGTLTITAQIVDKCGMSYNLTSNIFYLPIEMLPVEGGTFQMGSSDAQDGNGPVHSVILSSFNISKYEITQAQWKAVMGGNPSSFANCDNCPVENISWQDIQLFLTQLNKLTSKTYRLPTEAEWEYAARGGKLSKGYTYSGSNTIDDVAWVNNYGGKTRPVGQKAPNELGIYDMSGNVWEFCQDWYGEYPSDTQQNPKGASTGTFRMSRGGSFDNDKIFSRVFYRGYATPDKPRYNYGFRVISSQ